MNKIFAIGIAAVIAALFLGGVYAAGQWGTQGAASGKKGMMGAQERGLFHEQMEEIMETGTYDDLVALREETGRPMMPLVDTPEEFAEMQERHEQMEAQYGEGPHHGMMGRGQGRGMMGGGRGGCHGQQ